MSRGGWVRAFSDLLNARGDGLPVNADLVEHEVIR
jgi:hypothetical protein